MAEYKRPTSEAEFKKNFKLKKPLMNSTEAYYASSKCLFCYDAPCINACPTSIDIPLFIKQIHTGNTEGAARTIYDSNWMGNACGTICPTGELCEGACVYIHQNVLPVEIGRLQHFATKAIIESGKHLYKAGSDNGRKVGIIGGGPAGLSCACELRVLGYQVDIFEAKGRASGLTVHGIAPYKISNEEVMSEIAYLEAQMGYKIKYNTPITSKEQLTALEKEYNALFIGVGLGETATLGMKGEYLENVVGAVEFIEELRLNHHKTNVSERVIVLGGGNTAMDAASESARMGAKEVTLVYRRSKSEMGGYLSEYQSAVSSGVMSIFNAAPIEIVGNDKVEGVKFVRTESVDGKLTDIVGSEFVLLCDMVIKATGQAKKGKFLKLIEGLQLDSKTRIKVNLENNQTTNPKYFAGGDAINGGAEVVNSVYDGKLAANGIHKWLNK